jgi:hypothetical protein
MGDYSTDVIDDIIDYMDSHGLNIYRMSIYYTVDDATRDAMIQYFLDNCAYQLIVCRHVYDPGGTLSDSQWQDVEDWTIDVCDTFDAYADRLWVEFVNECGQSNLGTKVQAVVTAARNAGYTHRLVANKWTQSWSSMAINDPLGKFYSGMHFYFNSWSVNGAISQMNTAKSAGVQVFNTEIGADYNEEGGFSQSEVQEVNDFLAWCADSENRIVGNAVWMRYGLQNADTYTSLGLDWPEVSAPVADDTNLAPMFQGGTGVDDGCEWGQYDGTNLYYGDLVPEHQICFRDDAVKYGAYSSVRLEAPNEFNPYREVNNKWFAVRPGDVVFFRAIVKTDAGEGNAAIIGFDVYGPTSRILEVHKCTPQTAIWNLVDGVPTQGGTANYVEYGTDWTILEFYVTIPSTVYSFDDFGNPITPQQITGLIPWVGGVWNGRESYPDVWFANAELFVNPSTLDNPPVTQTITASVSGGNGAISPTGAVSVAYGGSQSFTWTPDEGYVLDELTVDSVATSNSGSYTFWNVQDDHTITVSFAEGEAPAVAIAAIRHILTMNNV